VFRHSGGFRPFINPAAARLRRGWHLVRCISAEADRDNLGIVSAGVAFYAFLAIFPALAALVSVYGLVTDSVQAEQQLRAISSLLPLEAYMILVTQVRSVAATPGTALGLGVAGGLLLAVWSASKGTKALITALNIAYGGGEQRGFFRRNGVALLITFAGVVAAVLSLFLVAVIPAVLSFFELPPQFRVVISLIRWSLLALLIALGLALLYRFAPSTRLKGVPKRGGLTPGAVLAALLWLLASALFSWYAASFGDYNKTYGSVGAIAMLLLWFSFGAYAILLGAELDAFYAQPEGC